MKTPKMSLFEDQCEKICCTVCQAFEMIPRGNFEKAVVTPLCFEGFVSHM